MFNLLVSAGGWLFSYVLRGATLKWIFAAILFYGITSLVEYSTTLLPEVFDVNLSGLFSFLTPGMWYFFDYAQGGLALSMIFSAVVVRFLIRRIPFIG